MNLQTLFQFAGLPTDFGSVPRARKAKAEEFTRANAPKIAAVNKPEPAPDIKIVADETSTSCHDKTPEPSTVRFDVEVTDTFGGESNYSWVIREVITVPIDATDRTIVAAAKKAMGWTGVKCDTDYSGDMITLRPRGVCQIMFITYKEG